MALASPFLRLARDPRTWLIFGAFLLALFCLLAEKPWSPKIWDRAFPGPGRTPQTAACLSLGLWIAAAFDAVVLLALAATYRLWACQPQPLESPPRSPDPWPAGHSRWPRALLLLMLAFAVLLGLEQRLPRLSHSLWSDEAYMAAKNVHGEARELDGHSTFSPVSWRDAVFFNKGGNNHIGSTIEARLSLSAWRALTGVGRGSFSEAAARFPALLSSLLTIVLIFALGRALGLRHAALAAAFLLALSPWHIRYSVEMRGYSTMLFALCLALVASLDARRSNRPAAWAIFGLAQCLALLCFPGVVYALLAWNAALLSSLCIARRWHTAARLIAANALGAMLFLPLFLPSLPQIAAFAAREDVARLALDARWSLDLQSHLFAGIPASMPSSPPSWGFGTFTDLAPPAGGSSPPLRAMVSWGAPALLGLGLLAFLLTSHSRRLFTFTVLAAPPLALWHYSDSGFPIYGWYLLYILPFVALAIAGGVELALAPLSRLASRLASPARLAAPLALGLLVVAYAILTRPARELISSHDRQPIRQAAALAAEISPHHAAYGTSREQAPFYQHQARVIKSMDDLQAALDAAAAEKAPLAVFLCGIARLQSSRDPVYTRIRNLSPHPPDLLYAAEPLFTYEVYTIPPQ